MRVAKMLFPFVKAGGGQGFAGKPYIVADASVFPETCSAAVIVGEFPIRGMSEGMRVKCQCRKTPARLQDGMNSLCPGRKVGKPA